MPAESEDRCILPQFIPPHASSLAVALLLALSRTPGNAWFMLIIFGSQSTATSSVQARFAEQLTALPSRVARIRIEARPRIEVGAIGLQGGTCQVKYCWLCGRGVEDIATIPGVASPLRSRRSAGVRRAVVLACHPVLNGIRRDAGEADVISFPRNDVRLGQALDIGHKIAVQQGMHCIAWRLA
jgi:hypothetical protein